MPEIPQFRASEPIASLPEPVMDRAQRPRLDINGAINAVERLADSMRGTEVSQYLSQVGAEAFGGQSAKALGAVAEGVADVGRVFADLHERKLKALNDHDLEKGRALRAQSAAEFDVWRATEGADKPELWESELQSRQAATEGKLLEQGYSRQVMDQLGSEGVRWGSDISTRVSTDATKAIFARTGNMLRQRRSSEWDQNQPKTAMRTSAEMVAAGYTTQEEAELDAMANTRMIDQRLRVESMDKMIQADPRRTYQELKKPDAFPDLSGAEVKDALQKTEVVMSQRQHERILLIDKGIADGTIRVPEDIEDAAAGELEPVALNALKLQMAGEAKMDSDEFWNTATSIIDNFDTSKDRKEWETDLYHLRSGIQLYTTDGSIRANLVKRLDDHLIKNFHDPLNAKKRAADGMLQAAYESGVFGPISQESTGSRLQKKWVIPETVGEGPSGIGEMFGWTRSGSAPDAREVEVSVPLMMPYPAGAAVAEGRRRQTKITMDSWLDANPQASEVELQEELNRNTLSWRSAVEAQNALENRRYPLPSSPDSFRARLQR